MKRLPAWIQGAFLYNKMNNGWIKLHRGLLDWEWYDDNNTKILFLHFLLKANHKEKNYRGTLVKVGSFLTGISLLSKETGLTSQQIRTAIKKLKSTNEITNETSSQGTVIQLVNYKKYQVVTNEITNEQQTSNKRVTTNKKDKKEKNEKNTYRSFKHLSISNDEFNKLRKFWTKEQIDDVIDSVENWKNNTSKNSLYLTARAWLKKDFPIITDKQLNESTKDRAARLTVEHKKLG